MAKQQESRLVVRMVWIVKDDRQRILKDGSRFLEADSVLLQIRLCLLGIPLDVQAHPDNVPAPGSAVPTLSLAYAMSTPRRRPRASVVR